MRKSTEPRHSRLRTRVVKMQTKYKRNPSRGWKTSHLDINKQEEDD